ncbi:unnamed protein product [Cuscuta europaea]|uniref:Uncharacterized protein n=2 Tax=Cuscuta europaea TaxID=41803 RepID=A0A9P0ZSZ0_CUSEU|nr:unnamed protein product [Cuscuta europaea]CAH9113833.1 unnamed protein product [Cuscuta europaea]
MTYEFFETSCNRKGGLELQQPPPSPLMVMVMCLVTFPTWRGLTCTILDMGMDGGLEHFLRILEGLSFGELIAGEDDWGDWCDYKAFYVLFSGKEFFLCILLRKQPGVDGEDHRTAGVGTAGCYFSSGYCPTAL